MAYMVFGCGGCQCCDCTQTNLLNCLIGDTILMMSRKRNCGGCILYGRYMRPVMILSRSPKPVLAFRLQDCMRSCYRVEEHPHVG